MFDEARLAVIDKDLAGAQQGDRDAQLRVINTHVSWLLHFARYVNTKVAAFDAEQAEWENTSDELETEADSDKADPVVSDPDVVENEGEPLGARGADDDPVTNLPTPEAEDDPLEELVLKPHQVFPPLDYEIDPELFEAAGGEFFEPGFTPEDGYTAPWLIDEDDEADSETENNGEEE